MSRGSATPAGDAGTDGGEVPRGGEGPALGPRAERGEGPGEQPCLRCGVPLPARLMGCKGGHCPNCGHPYPHGDCSD